MKTIVITGSTRGIGFNLAREFLKRNCRVVISGRTPEAIARATQELVAAPDQLLGVVCEVTDFAQVQTLWQEAIRKFGRVDIWINNAGIGQPNIAFWLQTPEIMREVVTTNVIGTMYGCKVASDGMLKQGGGTIYNMEGFGSSGRTQFGLGIYGSTKAAITFFTKSLNVDAKDTPLKFGTILPGMVLTDFVLGQYQGREAELEKVKGIFNIIADKAETVTPFIAAKVLAGETKINWLSPLKLMWRFATARISRRNLFEDQ